MSDEDEFSRKGAKTQRNSMDRHSDDATGQSMNARHFDEIRTTSTWKSGASPRHPRISLLARTRPLRLCVSRFPFRPKMPRPI